MIEKMNVKRIVLLIGICVAIVSCNNEEKKTQNDAESTKDSAANAYRVRSGLEWEPLLQQADSLEILYYDNPDGDSLRYTRFFKYTATKDSGTINGLLANFRQPVEQRNAIKECRSEGKIYVLGKGQPLKTVYFSTRCDTCCYLYYIKSGAFYYSKLSEGFKNTLIENKKFSRKP